MPGSGVNPQQAHSDKRRKAPKGLSYVVREGGVEPPRPFGHTDLNRARLPIPPLAREAVRRLSHADLRTQTGGAHPTCP